MEIMENYTRNTGQRIYILLVKTSSDSIQFINLIVSFRYFTAKTGIWTSMDVVCEEKISKSRGM